MSATVTQPFLQDLLADPVKYPDSTKYRMDGGKETTLGELRKSPVTAAQPEILPESPNAATDKRISEVLESKKKKKHPVEARIGELTKRAKELEDQLVKDKQEFDQKLAQQNEKNIKAELERRKAEAAANDKRPVREEFAADASGTADYTQKMAEWVIRQQEKITPKIVTPTDTTARVSEVDAALRKEEFDGFLETGREFMKNNPDFNDVLQKAADRGLNLNNAAMLAIIKLRAPNVAYFLAKPENETTARRVMALDPMAQVAEVGRIAERLTVSPTDFISRAPAPGPRLTGSTAAIVETDPEKMDTDTYLMKRRADIKAGIRRR